MKAILSLSLVVLMSSTGCAMTGAMRNSLARGSGDTGATIVLDKTSGLAKVPIDLVLVRLQNYIDGTGAPGAPPMTAPMFKVGLLDLIPEDQGWLAEGIESLLTGILAEDKGIIRNFLIGVRNGTEYWFPG